MCVYIILDVELQFSVGLYWVLCRSGDTHVRIDVNVAFPEAGLPPRVGTSLVFYVDLMLEAGR